MGLHGVVGRPFMWELYTKALRISEDYIIDLGLPKFNVLIDDSSHINAEAFLAKGMQLIYYFVVVFLIFVLTKMLFMNKVVFVDGVKKIVPAEGNRRSGRALLICLAIRIVPAVIMHHSHIVAYTQEQIISDGLFLSILTSDIIIAKVSDRPVHSLIIVMTMCSIMSNFSIYAFLLLYYGSVFGDISSHLNLPILNTVTNIYCDGVFDMLHRGHMEQFRKAHGSVAGGVRLFVGVVNDADATQYKRKPIMSEDERYAAVESCKYVHAVIRDSPTIHASSEIGEKKKTVTEQMIEDYHLHYFAVGKEYEVPKEGKVDYYECPRKLGMIKYTSRTEGVSTSTVIARIVERANELKD
jgi:cytidyltransferase-like protein